MFLSDFPLLDEKSSEQNIRAGVESCFPIQRQWGKDYSWSTIRVRENESWWSITIFMNFSWIPLIVRKLADFIIGIRLTMFHQPIVHLVLHHQGRNKKSRHSVWRYARPVLLSFTNRADPKTLYFFKNRKIKIKIKILTIPWFIKIFTSSTKSKANETYFINLWGLNSYQIIDIT